MSHPTIALTAELAGRVRSIASEHGIASVRVFGSAARGEAGARSDLDLLIRLEPGRGFADLLAFCEAVEEAVGRRVDAVTEDALSPYMRERVLAEAVPL